MKKCRFCPGTVVLREIQRYQKLADLLLPKILFQCVVRDIDQEINNDVRFQVQAPLAVQEALEAYPVDLFEDVNLLATHARHITITSKDIQLVCRIHGGRI